MATTISNSTVANTIFGTNGNAITSQPNNSKKRVAGPTLTTATSEGVSAGIDPEKKGHAIYIGLNGIVNKTACPNVDEANVAGAALNIVLLSGISKNIVRFSPGDYFLTNKGYLIKVYSFDVSQQNFYFSAGTNVLADWFNAANPYFYYFTSQDVLKGIRKGKFIISGFSQEIAGSTNDAIQGGATGPNRGVNGFESLRTTQTAAAIRAGHWNEYAGDWDTNPTGVNDYATMRLGVDTAYSGVGRITITPGGTPTNVSYDK